MFGQDNAIALTGPQIGKDVCFEDGARLDVFLVKE
jgi:hypothetical protein